jgi:hypothetical protein
LRCHDIDPLSTIHSKEAQQQIKPFALCRHYFDPSRRILAKQRIRELNGLTNSKRQTRNVKLETSNSKRQTRNVKLDMPTISKAGQTELLHSFAILLILTPSR